MIISFERLRLVVGIYFRTTRHLFLGDFPTLALKLSAKVGKSGNESADKPGSVVDSHSSGMHVTMHLKRPTRVQRGPRLWTPIWSCSEWGFPSPWTVTSHAVRSYRTISTLPVCRSRLRRYTFCCTFRRLAPPRRYLALCPMEPGLSSTRSLTLG